MSESAVVPFNFQSHEVRTVDIGGEPWFVAKDVCGVLGLDNTTKALLKIPGGHKGVNPIQTLGGIQKMNVIDESGLYRLILRSDKPQAEPFMEWVTSEVLPAIRKTGQYIAQQQPKHGQLALVLEDYQAAVAMAKMVGLDGNQAFLDEVNGLANTARKVNVLLERMGFQIARYVGKKKTWVPVDNGLPFAVLLDTNKHHNCGTPVQQLKWKESVVKEIVRFCG